MLLSSKCGGIRHKMLRRMQFSYNVGVISGLAKGLHLLLEFTLRRVGVQDRFET